MRARGLLLGALSFSFACAPTVRHVEFLADADCSRAPVSVTRLEGLRITARCVDEGPAEALHLTVANANGRGSLRAFNLEFCGTAISIDTPEGWIFRFLEKNPEPDIEFQIRDEAAPSFSIPPNKSLDGFVIRLTPVWRRMAASCARWDELVEANGTTHDWCQ
jgi:hypothetical protein